VPIPPGAVSNGKAAAKARPTRVAAHPATKNVVDGSYGFPPQPKLYSDALVQRGRGFDR